MSAKNHPRRKRLDRARRDGHFEARCKKQIPEKGDENVVNISSRYGIFVSVVKNRSPKEGTKTPHGMPYIKFIPAGM